MRKMADHYGFKLTRKLKTCVDCLLGKSQQKNVSKERVPRAITTGARIFIDITSIQHQSVGGAKFWLLAMDDKTDLLWSWFVKQKSDQVDVLVPFLKDMRAREKIVKQVWCDNAGENRTLDNECQGEELGIEFEFTPPNSPQFNRRIERRIQTLYNKV